LVTTPIPHPEYIALAEFALPVPPEYGRIVIVVHRSGTPLDAWGVGRAGERIMPGDRIAAKE